MDDACLKELACHARRRKFRAQETVCHQGDSGHSLYIVLSGQLQILKIMLSGEILHLAQRGPGEIVGEMALIDGKPRMADVRALGECELLVLEREAFRNCIATHPDIALHVMGYLADRLRQAADALEARHERPVVDRVAQALWNQIVPPDSQLSPPNPPIRLQIRQRQLATQVTASREAVNRALATLKAEGVLAYEGYKLIVLDAESLRRRVER
jgi:CRP-like cAMP-binding protein